MRKKRPVSRRIGELHDWMRQLFLQPAQDATLPAIHWFGMTMEAWIVGAQIEMRALQARWPAYGDPEKDSQDKFAIHYATCRYYFRRGYAEQNERQSITISLTPMTQNLLYFVIKELEIEALNHGLFATNSQIAICLLKVYREYIQSHEGPIRSPLGYSQDDLVAFAQTREWLHKNLEKNYPYKLWAEKARYIQVDDDAYDFCYPLTYSFRIGNQDLGLSSSIFGALENWRADAKIHVTQSAFLSDLLAAACCEFYLARCYPIRQHNPHIIPRTSSYRLPIESPFELVQKTSSRDNDMFVAREMNARSRMANKLFKRFR